MPLGAEHEEPAGCQHLSLLRFDFGFDLRGLCRSLLLVLDRGQVALQAHFQVAAELDVGAAAGHVRGNRDRARHARLGDDVGFLFVVARVEDLVFDFALCEMGGQLLRLFDTDRADQNRLVDLGAFLDLVDDRRIFFLAGAVDLVVGILADHRLVGRRVDHFKAIDLAEFGSFRQRRAGHARELGVHAEVVLEGDRGQRLVLVLDLDVLLRLERLVQPVGIAPALHHAPGELVDDDDLVVLDDVVGVALEQLMRAERLVHVMDQRDVLDVVERPFL